MCVDVCLRLKTMCVYRCIHTNTHIYLFVCLVCRSIFLSLSLSRCIFLSLSLSLARSVGPSVCRSVYLSIYLSFCLQDCRKQDFTSRNSIQSCRHCSSVYTCTWRVIRQVVVWCKLKHASRQGFPAPPHTAAETTCINNRGWESSPGRYDVAQILSVENRHSKHALVIQSETMKLSCRMTFYLKDVNAMGNQYIAKRHSTTGEGIGEGTQLFRYYKRRRKREEETSFDLSADPYWNFGGPSWGDPQNSSAGPALEFLGSPSRDITHMMCNWGHENARGVCLEGPPKFQRRTCAGIFGVPWEGPLKTEIWHAAQGKKFWGSWLWLRR